MPLSFRCPGCGNQHTVADKMAGKQVYCKCGVLLAIPANPRLAADSQSTTTPAPAKQTVKQPAARQPPAAKGTVTTQPEKIPANCPGCGTKRLVPAAFRGKKVGCPCGTAFHIGGAAANPPTPSPQTPTPQKSTPQTAKPQPTTVGTNTSGSLFDELTEGDWGGELNLQPLESSMVNPGREHLTNALSNPSLEDRIRSGNEHDEEAEGNSLTESIGYGIFFVLCAWPALEMNGFGVGLPINFPLALLCATIGGVVGGALVCPRPVAAGLVGGLLSGPPGLVAVYLYTLPRESVYVKELVIIQGLASLPGVGVGIAIRKLMKTGGRSRARKG